MKIETDRVYTPTEVAKLLGVTPRTVRREITDGELVAYRIGGHYRVHGSDLAAYIEAARTVAVTR